MSTPQQKTSVLTSRPQSASITQVNTPKTNDIEKNVVVNFTKKNSNIISIDSLKNSERGSLERVKEIKTTIDKDNQSNRKVRK